MKIGLIHAALAFLLLGSIANSQEQKSQPADSSSELQTVTLHSPMFVFLGQRDSAHASFSFRLGTYTQYGSKDSDLEYGMVSTDSVDWFRLSLIGNSRTSMKNLGQLNWEKSFKVPKLDPLPELKPGKKRNKGWNTSGDDFEDWANRTVMFARVEVGHIYEVHVKEKDSDFYVLFRVENWSPKQSCEITWKRIPEPGNKTK